MTEEPKEAKYEKLAATIRQEIEEGKYREGQKLPSEREMNDLYDASRSTARQAVRLLAADGLVDVSYKSGARVKKPPRFIRLGAERYSQKVRNETGKSPFRYEVEKLGKVPHVDCTSIEPVEVSPEIAQRLNLDVQDEAQVIRRENWYFADNQPVQKGVTYIPTDVAGDSVLAHSANLGPGSLYARFQDQGHTITKIIEEISCRYPTSEERTRLKIPDLVPVIDLVHTGINQHGEPFEVTVFTMRADAGGLKYEITIED